MLLYIALFLGLIMIMLVLYIVKASERLQSTIDRQNDTIQRLLSREPVTYSEVGKVPTKKATDVYAAWGSQIVNIDEDERS